MGLPQEDIAFFNPGIVFSIAYEHAVPLNAFGNFFEGLIHFRRHGLAILNGTVNKNWQQPVVIVSIAFNGFIYLLIDDFVGVEPAVVVGGNRVKIAAYPCVLFSGTGYAHRQKAAPSAYAKKGVGHEPIGLQG
jgi:hypothetical protein